MLNSFFLLLELTFIKPVRGWLGRLWTWIILLSVGCPLADTWLRTGAGAGLGGEEGILPWSPTKLGFKWLGWL